MQRNIISTLSILLIVNILSFSFLHNQDSKNETPIISEAYSVDPFLGEIILFAGNFAPRGWAFCEGQLLAINQNQSLYALLGTYYGGDGETTFALPDLRGRAPLQPGNVPGINSYSLGERMGDKSILLNSTHIPSHTHTASGSMILGSSITDEIGKDRFVSGQTGESPLFIEGSTSNFKDLGTDNIFDTSNAGLSQQVSNYQPSLGVNYIISLNGTFPSQN
ncbi:phage tail protein [Portibacter lacus]|uniref:Tail Collar domain-containing protein n=1 Tax=Portibacter lacus TaxID=1099794 RepID=A0AA37WD65_9BACT|nr:tail fiber protein [Portibacter lacus]GLR15567.1 tail Collar domain-containing protein [Portibacter lacus]